MCYPFLITLINKETFFLNSLCTLSELSKRTSRDSIPSASIALVDFLIDDYDCPPIETLYADEKKRSFLIKTKETVLSFNFLIDLFYWIILATRGGPPDSCSQTSRRLPKRSKRQLANLDKNIINEHILRIFSFWQTSNRLSLRSTKKKRERECIELVRSY